jgi:hypothetical protein
MGKYVRETNAARSISAYVILKAGREVATVNIYHGQGRVLVNIWQTASAIERCAKAVDLTFPNDERKAHSTFQFQHATAGGYGYDRVTSALSGLMIDGHKLSDHCERTGAPKPPKGRKTYPRDYKTPRGYTLANWVSSRTHPNVPNVEEGYTDCYRLSGFEYLTALGYTVLQAI